MAAELEKNTNRNKEKNLTPESCMAIQKFARSLKEKEPLILIVGAFSFALVLRRTRSAEKVHEQIPGS